MKASDPVCEELKYGQFLKEERRRDRPWRIAGGLVKFAMGALAAGVISLVLTWAGAPLWVVIIAAVVGSSYLLSSL